MSSFWWFLIGFILGPIVIYGGFVALTWWMVWDIDKETKRHINEINKKRGY